MSVIRAAASGAFWSIGIGVGVRVVGLVGTLAITHYLSPDVLGEVAAATILAMTANWLSHWGFNQYVIVKGGDSVDGVYHAAVLHLSLGLVAIAAVLALGDRFSTFLNAPNLDEYLPGMAIVVLIKRFGSIPDKLLIREMRFKYIALASGTGELAYISLAVALVVDDRSGRTCHRDRQHPAGPDRHGRGDAWRWPVARWLAPKPWRWKRVGEILRFGAPIGMESILFEIRPSVGQADVFALVRAFHTTGMYSLSYNLSDLPASLHRRACGHRAGSHDGQHRALEAQSGLRGGLRPARPDRDADGRRTRMRGRDAGQGAAFAANGRASPTSWGCSRRSPSCALSPQRSTRFSLRSERTWPLLWFELLKMSSCMFGGIALLSHPTVRWLRRAHCRLGSRCSSSAGLVVLSRQRISGRHALCAIARAGHSPPRPSPPRSCRFGRPSRRRT